MQTRHAFHTAPLKEWIICAYSSPQNTHKTLTLTVRSAEAHYRGLLDRLGPNKLCITDVGVLVDVSPVNTHTTDGKQDEKPHSGYMCPLGMFIPG